MDTKGINMTIEFYKNYFGEDSMCRRSIDNRIDCVAAKNKQIYLIETKIRDNELQDFQVNGKYKLGFMIEKIKIDYIQEIIKEFDEKKIKGHYINFLKDAVVVFDITNFQGELHKIWCNTTTHGSNRIKKEKEIYFIPLKNNIFVCNTN